MYVIGKRKRVRILFGDQGEFWKQKKFTLKFVCDMMWS